MLSKSAIVHRWNGWLFLCDMTLAFLHVPYISLGFSLLVNTQKERKAESNLGMIAQSCVNAHMYAVEPL